MNNAFRAHDIVSSDNARSSVSRTPEITRRAFIRGVGAIATLSASSWAYAQSAMIDQAKILVGFPAGGGSDSAARRVAEGIRGNYARVVIVENKAGASGKLAIEEIRRGPTNGSLMIMQPDAAMVNQPYVDPINTRFQFGDLSPIVSVGRHDHALMLGPMVPNSINSMKTFLAWAKTNPQLASFGTPGANSTQYILMRSAMRDHSFELVHVPYKGSAPGMQDLIGGQLASFFSPVGDSLPYRDTLNVRVIGTTGARRSKFTPDVPTFEEQGFKGMELTERMGLWMNRDVPESEKDRLHDVVLTMLKQPSIVEHFEKLGFEPDLISRGELDTVTRNSYADWGERVRNSGYKPGE